MREVGRRGFACDTARLHLRDLRTTAEVAHDSTVVLEVAADTPHLPPARGAQYA